MTSPINPISVYRPVLLNQRPDLKFGARNDRKTQHTPPNRAKWAGKPGDRRNVLFDGLPPLPAGFSLNPAASQIIRTVYAGSRLPVQGTEGWLENTLDALAYYTLFPGNPPQHITPKQKAALNQYKTRLATALSSQPGRHRNNNPGLFASYLLNIALQIKGLRNVSRADYIVSLAEKADLQALQECWDASLRLTETHQVLRKSYLVNNKTDPYTSHPFSSLLIALLRIRMKHPESLARLPEIMVPTHSDSMNNFFDDYVNQLRKNILSEVVRSYAAENKLYTRQVGFLPFLEKNIGAVDAAWFELAAKPGEVSDLLTKLRIAQDKHDFIDRLDFKISQGFDFRTSFIERLLYDPHFLNGIGVSFFQEYTERGGEPKALKHMFINAGVAGIQCWEPKYLDYLRHFVDYFVKYTVPPNDDPIGLPLASFLEMVDELESVEPIDSDLNLRLIQIVLDRFEDVPEHIRNTFPFGEIATLAKQSASWMKSPEEHLNQLLDINIKFLDMATWEGETEPVKLLLYYLFHRDAIPFFSLIRAYEYWDSEWDCGETFLPEMMALFPYYDRACDDYLRQRDIPPEAFGQLQSEFLKFASEAITFQHHLLANGIPRIEHPVLQNWGEIGTWTHSAKLLKFDTKTPWKGDLDVRKDKQIALLQAFDPDRISRLPARPDDKIYHSGYLYENPETGVSIEFRRAYWVVSKKDAGSLVIRNSSTVFGRDLLPEVAYYGQRYCSSKTGLFNPETEIPPPSIEKHPYNEGFRLTDHPFQSVIGPALNKDNVREKNHQNIKLLLEELQQFRNRYRQWKSGIHHRGDDIHFPPGFIRILEIALATSEASSEEASPPFQDTLPRSLAWVHHYWTPYPIKMLDLQDPIHREELTYLMDFIRSGRRYFTDEDEEHMPKLLAFLQLGLAEGYDLILTDDTVPALEDKIA